MTTLFNQNGTNSADVLELTVNGIYNANGGNDTINIKGGSVVVYTNSGNNIINVTGGRGHTVKVAENDKDSDKINGVEKLNINGADIVDAYLGSGKDEIVLENTNGKNSNGVLSMIHGGAWGDTFTVKDGVQNYQLYGDAGNDVFNISGGSNINFWGGAANDTFNVTGGNNNKLYGGDSTDTFNISAGNQNMTLGYGNDIVNVTAGNNQKIKANLGINTINLKAGSGHVITADIDKALSKKNGYTDEQIKNGEGLGYGQDKVYISGTASSVTANLGDGRDYVSVSSGSGHRIYTEGWTDTIEISGSTHDSVFDAGAGDDIINISGGTNNSFYAGDGDDIIYVNDGRDNFIECGKGNDTVIIDWRKTESVSGAIVDGEVEKPIIAMNESEDTADFDSDKLVIQNSNLDNFNYRIVNYKRVLNTENNYDVIWNAGTQQALVITDKNDKNKNIVVFNWDKNPLSSITIGSSFLTTADINKLFESAERVNKENGVWNGSTGDDNIIFTGSNNQLNASSGNDKLLVNGNNNTINAGSGKNEITIKSNRGSEMIYGEEAVNVINVYGAKYVTVECGFTITEEELLAYEEGTLTGAAKEKIERYWNGTLEGDTVTVKDTSSIHIYGGAGNDKIILSGVDTNSRIGVLDADDGNDYIEISNADEANIAGGNGDDQYVIDWSTVKTAVIRNSNDPWPEPDHWADVKTSIKQENDTLVLKNVNYDEVEMRFDRRHYEYNGYTDNTVLRIQDKNDSKHYLEIAFWHENNIASIKFDDRILNAYDINKMLDNTIEMHGGPDVYGTNSKDTFVMTVMGGWAHWSGYPFFYGIYNFEDDDQIIAKDSMIDAWGGVVTYGGYQQEGNHLHVKINSVYKGESIKIGIVSLWDYFKDSNSRQLSVCGESVTVNKSNTIRMASSDVYSGTEGNDVFIMSLGSSFPRATYNITNFGDEDQIVAGIGMSTSWHGAVTYGGYRQEGFDLLVQINDQVGSIATVRLQDYFKDSFERQLSVCGEVVNITGTGCEDYLLQQDAVQPLMMSLNKTIIEERLSEYKPDRKLGLDASYAYNAMTSFSDTGILGESRNTCMAVQIFDNGGKNLIITGNVK